MLTYYSAEVKPISLYELTPIRQKSFYGKAQVEVDNKGGETLYSYGTPVIYRSPEGELFDLWGGYSATTQKHIKSFCGLNKAGVSALPYWFKEWQAERRGRYVEK